jgi:hypothetical protein
VRGGVVERGGEAEQAMKGNKSIKLTLTTLTRLTEPEVITVIRVVRVPKSPPARRRTRGVAHACRETAGTRASALACCQR